MTQSGIEPKTFRFVAHHLKHYVTAVPHLRRYGHQNWHKMKDACDLAVGINHTYIQPVVSKSPSTNLASIVDVDDLRDKLIGQGIRTSLYDLHRNTQTKIIDTLL